MSKSRKRPHWAWRLFKGLLIAGFLCAVAGAVVGGVLYYKYTTDEPLPDPARIMEDTPPQTSKIFDRNGREIGAARVPERRVVLSPDAIPDKIKAAVLSAEDKGFFRHGAVDYLAMAKAFVQGVKKGFKFRGASTLTQQLVKQHPEIGSKRTLRRKIRELALARKIEERYSKREILARYLNTVAFGHQRAGVAEAAQFYFGKPVQGLSWEEAATLASFINNPRVFVKKETREGLLRRRNFVLKELWENEYIVDPQVYNQAINAPIVLVNEQSSQGGAFASGGPAPEFLPLAEDYLHGKYGPDISRLGASVFMTLDAEIQEATRVALEQQVEIIDRQNGWRGRPKAAAVIMEVKTGKVVAMVGDYHFTLAQFNWATQGLRQPGSTAKSFVLAAALNAAHDGRLEIDPATAFYDVALTYQIPGSKDWVPHNYDEEHFDGLVDLRFAMAHSINTVFAQLMQVVGPETVVVMMRRLGIKSKQAAHLSLVLGSSDVIPIQLANAYRVFANGGMGSEPKFIHSENGVELPDSEQVRKLPAAVASQMTFVLQSVVEEGTAKTVVIDGVRKNVIEEIGPAAGKTGTTNGNTNAWFVGYTSDLVGVVWVGMETQKTSMGKGATGASYALPVWVKMMKSAIKKKYPNRGFSFTRPAPQAPHLFPGAFVPPNLPPSEAGDGGTTPEDGGPASPSTPPRKKKGWSYEDEETSSGATDDEAE